MLHLGNNQGDTTKHDIDLMTQSHVLIGGISTFFQMAAHLCDACVVLSTDMAKDASRMDKYIGRHRPRATDPNPNLTLTLALTLTLTPTPTPTPTLTPTPTPTLSRSA